MRVTARCHTCPVDCKWLSTGPVSQSAGMTKTPFDDPIAFDRNWFKADPQAKDSLAKADPLLFVADHISIHDRKEGAVALSVTSRDGQSTLIVVPDGPTHPSDAQCLALLGNAIERTPSGVRALGIVHHRRGLNAVCDVDQRWALALKAVSTAFDIEVLGVMARLYSGELVRVPLPDVLPADYFEGMGL